MKGKIFEIKRCSVLDGDGVRTTVFLKGCPLRCLWCHNPEGFLPQTQEAFYESVCIDCGECKTEGFTVYDCPVNARVLCGQELSVEELLPCLLADRESYEKTGGGVTLSGGECLMQADFCRELLMRLKECRISTAIYTSGFAQRDALDKVLEYTDLFLYDLKAFDSKVHEACTGQANGLILDNLKYLDSLGKNIEIRILLVPDYNSSEIEKLAEFISTLNSVRGIRLLPYHFYGRTKYRALGMELTLPKRIPTEEEMESARSTLRSITGLEVL